MTAEGIPIPDLKLHYRSIVVKTHGIDPKTDMLIKGIKLKDPNINPLLWTHLIFNKEAKNTNWEKDSNFQNWC